MLREITADDIEEIVTIHATSWSPDEISVKLGQRFLEVFYTAILESANATAFLYHHGDDIVGYASGFLKYVEFNQTLLQDNRAFFAKLVVSRFFQLELGIMDIFNHIMGLREARNLSFPDFHWGATALKNEYKGTEIGRKGIREAMESVMHYIQDSGAPGCWGACDADNIPMRKWLVKLEYKEVVVKKMFNRGIAYYELLFPTSTG